MSKIEEKAKHIAKRFKVQDAIVMSLYAATAMTLMLAAPNTVQLLKKVDPDMAKKRHPSRRISQAISRLKSKGFVEWDKEGKLVLTGKGKHYADKLESKDRLNLQVPKRWDGRWRIVIFDVWERRRPVRDRLRSLLGKIGFIKVQDSVWAYPYDCEELLVFIKTELKLGSGMLYLIAEGIEGDAWLRQHFKLPE